MLKELQADGIGSSVSRPRVLWFVPKENLLPRTTYQARPNKKREENLQKKILSSDFHITPNPLSQPGYILADMIGKGESINALYYYQQDVHNCQCHPEWGVEKKKHMDSLHLLPGLALHSSQYHLTSLGGAFVIPTHLRWNQLYLHCGCSHQIIVPKLTSLQ